VREQAPSNQGSEIAATREKYPNECPLENEWIEMTESLLYHIPKWKSQIVKYLKNKNVAFI